MKCGSQLKQLGLVLRSYHDSYSCFPPRVVANASHLRNGRYSGLVFLLPYLELHFVRYYIQFRVYQALSTIQGGEVAA